MLRKIVNFPRFVSKKCRCRIREAGVLSSNTYGLLTAGMTTTDCTRLRQMASRQMRAIVKLPAHLTHVPNVQARAILGAPDVVQQLHDAGGRHLTNLETKSEATPQDIRCHDIAVTQLRCVLTIFKPETDAADRETYGIKCDVCGLGFTTFNNMRKHKTRCTGSTIAILSSFLKRHLVVAIDDACFAAANAGGLLSSIVSLAIVFWIRTLSIVVWTNSTTCPAFLFFCHSWLTLNRGSTAPGPCC